MTQQDQDRMNELLAMQQRVEAGQFMYDDAVGHDACGIGGIAAKDGKATRKIIEQALEALKALEHRGGIFGESGDGAGILMQIPRKLFKRELKRLAKVDLTDEQTLVVGTFFIPFEPKN